MHATQLVVYLDAKLRFLLFIKLIKLYIFTTLPPPIPHLSPFYVLILLIISSPHLPAFYVMPIRRVLCCMFFFFSSSRISLLLFSLSLDSTVCCMPTHTLSAFSAVI